MVGNIEDRATFSILFVCTGNICRSPLAEQLFRSALSGSEMGVSVSSAGTRARSGDAMTPQAAASSLALGGNPHGHKARELTKRVLEDSDLVLTATLAQRAEVVTLLPRMNRTAFTLREFCRLLGTLDEAEPDRVQELGQLGPAGLDALVKEARSMRGLAQFLPKPGDDDILDPYRRDQSVYDQVGQMVNDSVSTIASAVLHFAPRQDLPAHASANERQPLTDAPALLRSDSSVER